MIVITLLLILVSVAMSPSGGGGSELANAKAGAEKTVTGLVEKASNFIRRGSDDESTARLLEAQGEYTKTTDLEAGSVSKKVEEDLDSSVSKHFESGTGFKYDSKDLFENTELVRIGLPTSSASKHSELTREFSSTSGATEHVELKKIPKKKKVSKLEGKKVPVKTLVKGVVAGTVVLGGVGTVGTLAAIDLMKNSSQKSGSNLHSGGLMLAPSYAQSPILSNAQFASNTTDQPAKTQEISPRSIELAHPVGSKSNPAASKSNPAARRHRSDVKRRVHSRQRSIYIVVIAAVALLLIAAGVFALIMTKVEPKKEDLFTDMNQYYANGSTKTNPTMPSIYPNASLNQHKNLI